MSCIAFHITTIQQSEQKKEKKEKKEKNRVIFSGTRNALGEINNEFSHAGRWQSNKDVPAGFDVFPSSYVYT